MPDSAPQTIRLADYKPPAFLIDMVDLTFDLHEDHAAVKARLAMRRDPAADTRTLVLDGRKLELVSVVLNGEALAPGRYTVDAEHLTIPDAPDRITLEIETRIKPQENLELEGLYKSGTMFCTQCEAEGFRKITYFLDRPDVMARYTTTITADRAKYPVLLSNGNRIAEGELDGGRHFARWEDPFPKPAYLFALVAGDLAKLEDRFVTRSGRDVTLQIWVVPADLDKCGHAMDSLKKSMKWDEEVYGLEYDLDIFMIVAVADFNMGAMENKGLNVFNTKYVLARPDTATDVDYAGIEAVIAHEYFHNWTGNRVTCRDWFQLSLKEGLTVFRDQQFSADMGSPAVKRISDVRGLRAGQFPEDASPMAHPVRPDSYIEINNFYTATVYSKGAEVVRMIHTLLGVEGFRKGMDLYFRRHDGQAVTCDDFVAAMEDASGVDLGRFRLWYAQAGTPELAVAGSWDAASKSYTLSVEQTVPPTRGQPDKQPMLLPFSVGLLDRSGRDLPLRLEGENAARQPGTRTLSIAEGRQTFRFIDIPEEPVPSLLRGFSAPVKLQKQWRDDDLQFLMAKDSDAFARWEAGQQLAAKLLLGMVADRAAGRRMSVDPGLVDAFAATLDTVADKAFAAQALVLPSEAYLGELMAEIDVDGIHEARQLMRRELALKLRPRWEAAYRDNRDDGPYRYEPAAVGKRALKNLALAYLVYGDPAASAPLALQQLEGATNMTDEMGALGCLIDVAVPERDAGLARFEAKWRQDALVMDKWFSMQALSLLPDTLDRAEALLAHPAFDIRNPNKVRAVIGAFASGNQLRFNAADGRGYAFLARQVLAIDPMNPKIAARLIGPMGRWRRFDKGRQQLMRGELERIVATPGLSKDVFEIASKSLD